MLHATRNPIQFVFAVGIMAVGCGRTAILPGVGSGPGGSSGGSSGSLTGGVSGSGGSPAISPTLDLLAGWLGGPGSSDGIGALARFSSPQGVAADGAGNLFVADSSNHTIRKVVIVTGAVTTLAGSPGDKGSDDGTGAAARFAFPRGVASDGAGNLFVADSGNHTIRKVVIATGVVTTLAGSPGNTSSDDGRGAAARFVGPVGIASDGAGNLFVPDGNTIRRVVIATGVVTTLAGSPGNWGSVASDGAGNLFVTDGNTIRKVVIATGAVTTLAGSPGNWGSNDGTGAAAQPFMPSGVASDGAGNLFVTDGNTIRKVVIATGAVTTLAGSADSFGSNDGAGAAASFSFPSGVASDGVGNLFVADSGNNTIRQVVITTAAVTTLAGSPDKLFSSGTGDGTGAAAWFASPQGVASDGAGNLFVADDHTIRKVVVATGAVTTFAGSPDNSGSDDGTGAAAQFAGPQGVASDGAGNLFVADYCTVRKVVIATGAVTTLAGSPGDTGIDDGTSSPGNFHGNDGTGSAARFHQLLGIASDGAGNLFVADENSIRKIVIATAAVTTFAGDPGWAGRADGTGTVARLYAPAGLTSDGAGNLFVADSGNSTIRKIAIATGIVTTLAGSPETPGSADGTGAAALFDHPLGVALDGAGNLFVADTGNSTIRKIVLATGAVTTVVGSHGHTGVVLGPLPAGLSGPKDLIFGSTKELFILDENAVLVAHF